LIDAATANVISSSQMLMPHWLKSSHVTGTINAHCFLHRCNMNVNSAFFPHHIAPQIPTPEKWNKIKTLCY